MAENTLKKVYKFNCKKTLGESKKFSLFRYLIVEKSFSLRLFLKQFPQINFIHLEIYFPME